jgi:hypothetical protein
LDPLAGHQSFSVRRRRSGARHPREPRRLDRLRRHGTAFLGALVVSIVSVILTAVLGEEKK